MVGTKWFTIALWISQSYVGLADRDIDGTADRSNSGSNSSNSNTSSSSNSSNSIGVADSAFAAFQEDPEREALRWRKVRTHPASNPLDVIAPALPLEAARAAGSMITRTTKGTPVAALVSTSSRGGLSGHDDAITSDAALALASDDAATAAAGDAQDAASLREVPAGGAADQGQFPRRTAAKAAAASAIAAPGTSAGQRQSPIQAAAVAQRRSATMPPEAADPPAAAQQTLNEEVEHEFHVFRRYLVGVLPGGTLPFSRKLMFWVGFIVQFVLPYPAYTFVFGFMDALFPGNAIVQASSSPLFIAIILVCTMLNVQLLSFAIPRDSLILDLQWFLRITFQLLITVTFCRALGLADAAFEAAANRRVCNPALLARKKFISALAFGAHVEGPLRASDDQAFLIFRFVWRPLCMSTAFVTIMIFMTVVARKSILGVYIFFGYIILLLAIMFGSTQMLVPDVYAGLVIFFERPFEEGDVVTVDKESTQGGAVSDINTSEITGFVEHVGLRATIIRRFDQRATWVPNTHLIKNPVANWNSRPRKLIFLEFTASQRAPTEVLAAFQQKVHFLVQNHPDVDQEQYTKAAFVRLEGGLNFRLVCLTGKDAKKEALLQDLLLKITSIARKLDVQISMKQQSMYMVQEDVGHMDYFLGEAKPTKAQEQLKSGGPELSNILPSAKDLVRTQPLHSPTGQLVVRIGSFDPHAKKGNGIGKYYYWAEIHLISDDAPVRPNNGGEDGDEDGLDRIPGRVARTRRVRISEELGMAPFLESLPLPLLNVEGLPIPPPRLVEARVICVQGAWHGRHKPHVVGTALVDVAALSSRVHEPAMAVVLNNRSGTAAGTLGLRVFVPEGTVWPSLDEGTFVAPAPVESNEPFESIGDMAAQLADAGVVDKFPETPGGAFAQHGPSSGSTAVAKAVAPKSTAPAATAAASAVPKASTAAATAAPE